MTTRNTRHGRQNSHFTRSRHSIGRAIGRSIGSQFIIDWTARSVELLMVVFTLFWAIEANAEEFQLRQTWFQEYSLFSPDADNDSRAPASLRNTKSGSSSSYGYSKMKFASKLARQLIPKSWLTLPSDSLPPPNLGVASAFEDYLNQKMKNQSTQMVYSASTVSPTLRQDPLFAPPSATLFRFGPH